MRLRDLVRRTARRVLSLAADKVYANIVSTPPLGLLDGRVVLITGGYGGLGRAFASAFLKSGARVVVAGRSEAKLHEAVEALAKEAGRERIGSLLLDMESPETFDGRLVEAIGIFGRIDALVNNAGVMGCTMPEASPERWDEVMDTNLKGTFFLSQSVIGYFRDNRIHGNILNIASSSSLRPAYSAYGISKWGVRGLTLGLAKMGAKYGITVNAIAPGPTATAMLGKESADELTYPFSPIGRFVHPQEIANMAVFLLSENGRTVVGDTVYMTGGAGLITFDDDEVRF